MIDWEEDENYFSDGSYGKYHQHDDDFSDKILKNSGFDVFKDEK